MGLESAVMIFPQDPAHRLVQDDLAAFLDRLAERLVALGSGATARLRAGRYEAEARSLLDLLESVDHARTQARGREDLRIRIDGLAQDRLAKFLGTPRVTLEFRAFVRPHVLLDACLCSGCGWPLDFDGPSGMTSCGRRVCGEGDPVEGELKTCWWLQFIGDGPDGIGERLVEEGRRFEGSPFLESLAGISRTSLFEWHTWG
jgi:hypothetical protein